MIVKVTIPNGKLSDALEQELTQLGLKVTRGMASIFLDGELGVATDGARRIEAEMTAEWDGFPSRLDMVAAMVYNARAQSPREMTPERWAQVRARFPGSARNCLEAAQYELENLDD